MDWKSWPYWLKGGMIGFILTLLIGPIFLILFSFLFLSDPFLLIKVSWIILFGIGMLVSHFFIYDILNWNKSSYVIIGALILSLIINFIVGAVIGLIVGKIKRRNKISKITKSSNVKEVAQSTE